MQHVITGSTYRVTVDVPNSTYQLKVGDNTTTYATRRELVEALSAVPGVTTQEMVSVGMSIGRQQGHAEWTTKLAAHLLEASSWEGDADDVDRVALLEVLTEWAADQPSGSPLHEALCPEREYVVEVETTVTLTMTVKARSEEEAIEEADASNTLCGESVSIGEWEGEVTSVDSEDANEQ